MEFRPVHPEFGVEVTGFDLARASDPAEIAELVRAYDEHSLLLFRGGESLSHARHEEVASWFGPPGPVDNMGNGAFVTVLDNKDAAGSVPLPFHSDQTYTHDPIRSICLQAIALPDALTSTTFVSGIAAWAALPGDLKARLEGKTLRHVLDKSATGMDWPTFVADHPVKAISERSGRPILLVTEHHATRILEMDEAQSDAVLQELYSYLYAPERRYEHVWQEGDLLVWDNMALQHARTAQSDPGEGRRALQRVALCNSTLPELIEIARAREAA